MKFLFSYEFPFHRLGYGGGHQVIRGLARELVRAGHEVHVCCTGRDELGLTAEDLPVRFHFGGKGGGWCGFDLAWRTLRLARAEQPDVVCCFTSEAVLVIPACNMLRKSTVMYLAAPDLPSFRFAGWSTIMRLRLQLDLFMQFLAARVAERVMVISDFAASQADQRWRIAPERLAVVPVGLDPAFFRPLEPSTNCLGHGGPRFISVGRLALAQKPLDWMADALAELPLAWQGWTIVGSGSDEPALRARIERLGLSHKTRFIGMRSSSEIVDLLADHDIALLPSTHESFFISAYEAVARGKVIVTNDVAEIRHYFAGDASVVIASEPSIAAYRASLCYAIENFQSFQSRTVAVALRVQQDHDWKTSVARFLESLA